MTSTPFLFTPICCCGTSPCYIGSDNFDRPSGNLSGVNINNGSPVVYTFLGDSEGWTIPSGSGSNGNFALYNTNSGSYLQPSWVNPSNDYNMMCYVSGFKPSGGNTLSFALGLDSNGDLDNCYLAEFRFHSPTGFVFDIRIYQTETGVKKLLTATPQMNAILFPGGNPPWRLSSFTGSPWWDSVQYYVGIGDVYTKHRFNGIFANDEYAHSIKDNFVIPSFTGSLSASGLYEGQPRIFAGIGGFVSTAGPPLYLPDYSINIGANPSYGDSFVKSAGWQVLDGDNLYRYPPIVLDYCSVPVDVSSGLNNQIGFSMWNNNGTPVGISGITAVKTTRQEEVDAGIVYTGSSPNPACVTMYDPCNSARWIGNRHYPDQRLDFDVIPVQGTWVTTGNSPGSIGPYTRTALNNIFITSGDNSVIDLVQRDGWNNLGGWYNFRFWGPCDISETNSFRVTIGYNEDGNEYFYFDITYPGAITGNKQSVTNPVPAIRDGHWDKANRPKLETYSSVTGLDTLLGTDYMWPEAFGYFGPSAASFPLNQHKFFNYPLHGDSIGWLPGDKLFSVLIEDSGVGVRLGSPLGSAGEGISRKIHTSYSIFEDVGQTNTFVPVRITTNTLNGRPFGFHIAPLGQENDNNQLAAKFTKIGGPPSSPWRDPSRVNSQACGTGLYENEYSSISRMRKSQCWCDDSITSLFVNIAGITVQDTGCGVAPYGKINSTWEEFNGSTELTAHEVFDGNCTKIFQYGPITVTGGYPTGPDTCRFYWPFNYQVNDAGGITDNLLDVADNQQSMSIHYNSNKNYKRRGSLYWWDTPTGIISLTLKSIVNFGTGYFTNCPYGNTNNPEYMCEIEALNYTGLIPTITEWWDCSQIFSGAGLTLYFHDYEYNIFGLGYHGISGLAAHPFSIQVTL
jgi:hypothetical protein